MSKSHDLENDFMKKRKLHLYMIKVEKSKFYDEGCDFCEIGDLTTKFHIMKKMCF